MKKIILVTALVFSLFSCKKVYQCECTQVNNYETWNPIITNVPIEENKKSDAEAICKSQDYNYGNGNYRGCKLK